MAGKDAPTPNDEREVVDPVAHRPIRIHDRTAQELDEITPLNLPENSPDVPLYGAVMDKVVSDEAQRSEWTWEATRRAHLSTTLSSVLSSTLGATMGLTAYWACRLAISPTSKLGDIMILLPSIAVGASTAATAAFWLAGVPPKQPPDQETSGESQPGEQVCTPIMTLFLISQHV